MEVKLVINKKRIKVRVPEREEVIALLFKKSWIPFVKKLNPTPDLERVKNMRGYILKNSTPVFDIYTLKAHEVSDVLNKILNSNPNRSTQVHVLNEPMGKDTSYIG